MRLIKLAFAAALTVTPMVAAQAQYFSPGVAPNKDGSPFWDVVSTDDGPGCNLGYVLSGAPIATCKNNQLSGYTAPYNSTTITTAWFAHAYGDPDASIGFKFYAAAGSNLTYYGGISGNRPLRELAIRDLSTGTILHVFNLSAKTYTFTGPGYFDVGIATSRPLSATPNFFSWTAVSPNQFAVFGNGTYSGNSASCGASDCWVGGEDRATGVNDWDYNDGILRISGADVIVPEPSQSVLLMGSLLSLVVVARRRKQA